MKFNVTFKTPDAIETALNAAFEAKYDKPYRQIEDDYFNCGCDEPEFKTLENTYKEAMESYKILNSLIEKYTSYGECVTVEFDSVANSVKVV